MHIIKERKVNVFNRLSFAATTASAILLGACSSTPVTQDAKVPTPIVVAPSPSNKQVTTKAAVPAHIASAPLAPYLDPASPLYKKRSIYFDFDQSNVRAEFAPVLEIHGKYLAANPTVAIRVQGNTDELGGTEYNLALGQKRAEAVTKALKIYGVKDAQVEAISFGEEKPMAAGHDEAAYTRNRRADLAYPAK